MEMLRGVKMARRKVHMKHPETGGYFCSWRPVRGFTLTDSWEYVTCKNCVAKRHRYKRLQKHARTLDLIGGGK